MATVREILHNKGTRIFTTSPKATVYEAALVMNEHKIGALLVIDEGQLIGMFTERDILQRVVAEQREASSTLVGEVMTGEVACCRLHTTIEEARTSMKNLRIRHLPVMDDNNRMLGLISIGDLNAFQANSQEMTIHLLHQYIYGAV